MLGSLIGIIIVFFVVRYLVKFLHQLALRRASRPVMNVSINYPADMQSLITETDPPHRSGVSRDAAVREPLRFDEPIRFPHKQSTDLDKPDPSLDTFFREFHSGNRRN